MRDSQIEADSANTRKNKDTNARVITELVNNFGSLVK
jgi:hypothetical protein